MRVIVIQEILDAPVVALSGASASDAKSLQSAFNTKAVGNLGKNKYFAAAAAVALHDLSQASAESRLPRAGRPYRRPDPLRDSAGKSVSRRERDVTSRGVQTP